MNDPIDPRGMKGHIPPNPRDVKGTFTPIYGVKVPFMRSAGAATIDLTLV